MSDGINWDALKMSAFPYPQLPQTLAGRLEWLMNMLHPPLYCDCKPDCDVIIGEGAPLISKELAKKLLEDTSEDKTQGL